MSSFLPRSAKMARSSRLVGECIFCARASLRPLPLAQIAPRLTSTPFSRTYATVNPGAPGPKKPKNGDAKTPEKKQAAGQPNDSASESGQSQDSAQESKHTSDPSHKDHPRSEPTAGSHSDNNLHSPEAPPGVRLTAEEGKVLNGFVALVKRGLPPSQGRSIDHAVKMIKKAGVPAELQEMLNERKEDPGKKVDLATTAKVIRLFSKLARLNLEEARKLASKEPPRRDQSTQDNTDETRSDHAKDENPKKKQASSKQKPAAFKADLPSTIIMGLVTYYMYDTLYPRQNSRDITWQEFKTTFFDKGLVDKLVVVNRSRVRVQLHREAVAQLYPESPAVRPNFHYYFTIGSVESFERRLDDAHQELGIPGEERIPVAYADEMPLSAALLSFGPTLLFVAGLWYLQRRATGVGGAQSSIFGIGKSRAKRFNHETDIQTKFSDVAGMDEAKVEIMEFVSFLKHPSKYQSLGAKIPRGAILSGPPGTGKTLLAKATAGESGVPFFSVSGSEFVEMFVGVGPSRVRDLFSNARKSTPCIIFIDEIDAIGKSRGKSQYGGGNDERESTLNQILTEMDGFNTSEQVVVLAGTNRADVLDQALLRPGRFDRHISIDPPTMDGRRQIFQVHLRKIVTGVDLGYLSGRLSALTPGFSGADIANCVNEAALIAARANASTVTMQHFEQAIERVIAGLEKKSMVMSPEEKKTVAYHEAGHAICGWFFRDADPLLKVSIIPRGHGALGYAQYLPGGGKDAYLFTEKQMMDRMAMTLGGRCSEELWFDTVTSGASDDFNKVTVMARTMVTEWGMSSKIGYLSYKDDNQRLNKPFSEDTGRTIDAEVRRIVDEAYNQCRRLLEEKRDQVRAVAEALLEKEFLMRDDLVRLLGKRPFPDKGDFHRYFGDAGGKSAPPPPPEMPNPAFRRADR